MCLRKCLAVNGFINVMYLLMSGYATFVHAQFGAVFDTGVIKFVLSHEKTWKQNTAASCLDHGTTPLEIKNDNEYQSIQTFLQAQQFSEYSEIWVDANFHPFLSLLNSPSEFTWSLGNSIDQQLYFNTKNNEPDGDNSKCPDRGDNARCLIMRRTDPNALHLLEDTCCDSLTLQYYNLCTYAEGLPNTPNLSLTQNVDAVLYCESLEGILPHPITYKWYKDEVFIYEGMESTLNVMANVIGNKSGFYSCSTVSNFGISSIRSKAVYLTIYEPTPVKTSSVFDQSAQLSLLDTSNAYGGSYPSDLDLPTSFWFPSTNTKQNVEIVASNSEVVNQQQQHLSSNIPEGLETVTTERHPGISTPGVESNLQNTSNYVGTGHLHASSYEGDTTPMKSSNLQFEESDKTVLDYQSSSSYHKTAAADFYSGFSPDDLKISYSLTVPANSPPLPLTMYSSVLNSYLRVTEATGYEIQSTQQSCEPKERTKYPHLTVSFSDDSSGVTTAILFCQEDVLLMTFNQCFVWYRNGKSLNQYKQTHIVTSSEVSYSGSYTCGFCSNGDISNVVTLPQDNKNDVYASLMTPCLTSRNPTSPSQTAILNKPPSSTSLSPQTSYTHSQQSTPTQNSLFSSLDNVHSWISQNSLPNDVSSSLLVASQTGTFIQLPHPTHTSPVLRSESVSIETSQTPLSNHSVTSMLNSLQTDTLMQPPDLLQTTNSLPDQSANALTESFSDKLNDMSSSRTSSLVIMAFSDSLTPMQSITPSLPFPNSTQSVPPIQNVRPIVVSTFYSIYVGYSVRISCIASHPDVAGYIFVKNESLNNVSVSGNQNEVTVYSGPSNMYTIPSLAIVDQGLYTCQFYTGDNFVSFPSEAMRLSVIQGQSLCSCQCPTLLLPQQSLLDVDVEDVKAEIRKSLSTTRNNLSSTIRKKTSAYDKRYSSKTIGTVAISILAVTSVFCLMADCNRVFSPR